MKKFLLVLAMFGLVGCSNEGPQISEPDLPTEAGSAGSGGFEIEPVSGFNGGGGSAGSPETEAGSAGSASIPEPPKPAVDFCQATCEKRGECNPKNGGIKSCIAECDFNLEDRMEIPAGANPLQMRQDWVDEVAECFKKSSCEDVNSTLFDGNDAAGERCAQTAWANLVPSETIVAFCNKVALACFHETQDTAYNCIENTKWVDEETARNLQSGTWFNCDIPGNNMIDHAKKRLGFDPFIP